MTADGTIGTPKPGTEATETAMGGATTLPRIAICGIHIEASTFSPHRSHECDFTVTRGDALLARYPFLSPGQPLAKAAEWVPILHARALPGGQLVASSYQHFKDEILTRLRAAGHLDGVLFDIHGAMAVEGLVDAEGDLIAAIRGVIGDQPVVSAPMDLHGNVSQQLFRHCDLLTCYRTAPHIDVLETRERAARNLLTVIASGRRPAKALVHVPVLLPGEMTSTRMEPARSLYAKIPQIEALPGIMDASIWIGFAWADEPRCQAAIVVTGDDRALVQQQALQLATDFWQARHEFSFVAPTGTFSECLAQALASDQRPFFLSDSGDNPGAGGADDCTYTLAELLGEPTIRSGAVSAALGSIVDPATVQDARSVGLGNTGIFHVGGKIDTRQPGPVELQAQVAELVDDPAGGLLAVLRVGGLSVIVTSKRAQYCTLEQWQRAGIDPSQQDIVVVKMGYLEPELFATQRGWLLALTPGGVDQDLVRLGHTHIERPMIPFDADVPAPTLTAEG